MALFRSLARMGAAEARRGFQSSSQLYENIGVVGIPLSKGQRKTGVDRGPDDLRDFGAVRALTKYGWNVTDYGNVAFEVPETESQFGNVKRPKTVGEATGAVADAVETALKENDVCLNLGGDHSLAIGTISGTARVHPDLCVLWVDAHADINTPLTSTSGSLHGMPLSFLIHEIKEKGLAPEGLPGFEWVKTVIDAKSLAYIGLRDVDPYEKLFIENLGIKVITIPDVDRYGIESCVQEALGAINPTGTRPLHVSFDIDALDPNYAPSTGTPVREGLTIRESLYIAEQVASSGCLRTLDLVEVNLSLGQPWEGERTLLAAMDIIQHHIKPTRQGTIKNVATEKQSAEERET